MASAQRFSVTETGGKKRSLVLQGRSMPSSPAGLGGGRTVVNVTWYPGNPDGSSQLIGAEEAENTIRGEWRDRYLTSSGKIFWDFIPVVNARDAVNALEELRLSGELLEVAWGDFFRQGWITEVKPFEYRTRERVGWEIDFQWVSRHAEKVPPWIEKQQNALGFIGEAVDFAKKAVQIVVEALEYAFEEIELINDTSRELADAVRLVEALGSTGLDVALRAKDAADRLLGVVWTGYRMAMNLKVQAQSIAVVDQASYMGWTFGLGSRHFPPPSLPPAGVGSNLGTYDGRRGAGLVPSDTGMAGVILQGGTGGNQPGAVPVGWHLPENSGMGLDPLGHVESGGAATVSSGVPIPELNDLPGYWRKLEAQDAAVLLLGETASKYKGVIDRLRELTDPGAPRRVRLRENEDLRHVAVRVYGDFTRWRDIAELNRISGSTVTAGTEIVLPD